MSFFSGSCCLQLLAEDVRISEVLHAQAHARRLVLVRRPDAPSRRADLVGAEPALTGAVQIAVVGHDEVCVAADEESACGDVIGLKAVDLLEKHLGIDDAAIADHGRDVRVHDPAGDQMQLERAAGVHDRVPRVVATLVPHDIVEVVRDQVGDLALAFVAPLSAEKNDTGHEMTPRTARSRGPSPPLPDRVRRFQATHTTPAGWRVQG